MAVFVGNLNAAKVISKYDDILMTNQYKTLLEECLESDELDLFDLNISLMAHDPSIICNQETLANIINTTSSKETISFITNIMIKEAEFEENTKDLLPIKGKITESFLLTDY